MWSIDCPLVIFFLIFSKSTLILEEYPEQNMKFLEENDIKFLQFGIAGNKVTTLLNIRMLSQRDDWQVVLYRNPLYKVG